MRLAVYAMMAMLMLTVLAGCAGKRQATSNQPNQPTPEHRADAVDLLERSAETVRVMRAQSEVFASSVAEAEAVLIFPNYFRLGYLASLAGAKGVLLVRDVAGFWSGPAFYSMGQVGGGFQVGLEYGALVYVINDPEIIPDIVQGRWQLDACAAVVVLSSDDRNQVTGMTDKDQAVLFTDMVGMFAGVSLDGAYVDVWQRAMDGFHGAGYTAAEVALEGKGERDGAEPLLDALHESVR